MKIAEVKPRKVYYDGWRRWAYEVESKDLMKNHWDCSCFKAESKDESYSAEAAKAYLLTHSPLPLTPYRYSESFLRKHMTSKLFILSRYAKQNNLLLSTNHFNQPKGTMLRLRNRVEITIVD